MKKIRLFVVDDNESFKNILKEHFSKTKDIEVTLESSDGEKAIEIIKNRSEEFDGIVLDVIIPKKDGISIIFAIFYLTLPPQGLNFQYKQ